MTWFNRFRMSVLQMTIDMFMTWFNCFRMSVLQMTIDMFMTWFNCFRISVLQMTIDMFLCCCHNPFFNLDDNFLILIKLFQ
jgi:hypothetical protein